MTGGGVVYAAGCDEVATALEGHGVRVAVRVSSVDLLYPLVVMGRAAAIVVAGEPETGGSLVDAVARLRLAAPACPVVVLSAVEDAAALERAGAAAVFRPPFDAGAIAGFLKRYVGREAEADRRLGGQAPAFSFPAPSREVLLREAAWSERQGDLVAPSVPAGAEATRVVAIFICAKGGVGRSLLAGLLSSHLARRFPGQVLLLDLDLSCGDLEVYLGAPPGADLSDVAAAGDGVDVALLTRCLRQLEPGFHFLPGPRRPETASSLTEAHVADLVAWACRHYRVVVVDTGTDAGDQRLSPALVAATHLVVPCLPEPAALRQGRLTLSVLAGRGVLDGRRVLVVLNRVRRGRGGVSEAAETLGVRPGVWVPDDPSLPGRLAGGWGFLGRIGGRLSPGVRGVARLADSLVSPGDGAWPPAGPWWGRVPGTGSAGTPAGYGGWAHP